MIIMPSYLAADADYTFEKEYEKSAEGIKEFDRFVQNYGKIYKNTKEY
jgi:hypothetical protein